MLRIKLLNSLPSGEIAESTKERKSCVILQSEALETPKKVIDAIILHCLLWFRFV